MKQITKLMKLNSGEKNQMSLFHHFVLSIFCLPSVLYSTDFYSILSFNCVSFLFHRFFCFSFSFSFLFLYLSLFYPHVFPSIWFLPFSQLSFFQVKNRSKHGHLWENWTFPGILWFFPTKKTPNRDASRFLIVFVDFLDIVNNNYRSYKPACSLLGAELDLFGCLMYLQTSMKGRLLFLLTWPIYCGFLFKRSEQFVSNINIWSQSSSWL